MQTKNTISFPVIVELDEDNIFIVSCPVFKGCHSYGKTIDEAIKNISEVIEICVEEKGYNLDSSNKYVGMREINLELFHQKSQSYA